MVLYATPHPEMELAKVDVTVVFTVDVIEAGTRRLARKGEVELRLWDVWAGGQLEYKPIDTQPLDEDGYPVTDENGMVIFPGCAGFTGLAGRNKYKFTMKYLETGDTKTEYLYLGNKDWSYKDKVFSYVTEKPYASPVATVVPRGYEFPFHYEFLRRRL